MFTSEQIQNICDHMNQDHTDALLLYAQVLAQQPLAVQAYMSNIDAQGITLKVTQAQKQLTLYISFDTPLESAEQAREKLVAMAKKARDKC